MSAAQTISVAHSGTSAPTPAGDGETEATKMRPVSGGTRSQLVGVALRPLDSGSCHVPAVSSLDLGRRRSSGRRRPFFRFGVGVAAALFSLPAAAQELQRFAIFDPPQSVVQLLVDDVGGALNDPASARFGGFLMGKSPGGDVMVCGYINAKNGFGGYSGMVPYMAFFHRDTGHFQLDIIGQSSSEIIALRSMCAQAGLPI